jgi:spermidine/putrescine transport system ATP-binding protein
MLELFNISKNFGNENALEKVNLKIQDGEFFSLLGPSGCGKTTLLRILAGLETATSGRITLNGSDVTLLPPQQRPFNMVFQKYALFPHLSVLENIEFGLKMKSKGREEIQSRTEAVLKLINLSGFEGRKPDTLSGGQAQRVALARALVNEPKVLLLDEPLSALDAKMREHMQTELRSLQKKLGLTFVFVTHDQEEALALSDRIAVMNNGRIEQVSSPQSLYEKPESQFVAEFIGRMNKISGQVAKLEDNKVYCQVGDQIIEGRNYSANKFSPGENVSLYLRHESMNTAVSNQLQKITGRVEQKIFKGDHFHFHLDVEGKMNLKVQLPLFESKALVGDLLTVYFSSEDVLVFPGERP